MGRHSRQSESQLRRNSVIALAGLVPVGAVAAANTAGADTHLPFFSVPDEAAAAAGVGGTPGTLAFAVGAGKSDGDVKPAVTAIDTEHVAPTPPPPPPLAPVQQTPPLPTSLAAGALGIPTVNVDAYQNAERILATTNPGCHMYWTLIAGIGRVESTHAYDGHTDEGGTMLEPVLGPVLDGSLAGNAVIHDTDGGALDGDAVYDRAVGPTQFLPETWNRYAMDGNGDGFADPQNVFDSAVTTGNYLCDGGLDMRDPAQAAKAVHRYNNSTAYVANVLAWSTGYATGIVPSEWALPAIH